MTLISIKKKITSIFTGWLNNITRSNHLAEYYAAKRLMYCDPCGLNDKGICSKKLSIKQDGVTITGCGCTISAKIRDLKSNCPRGLWKAEKNEKGV